MTHVENRCHRRTLLAVSAAGAAGWLATELKSGQDAVPNRPAAAGVTTDYMKLQS